MEEKILKCKYVLETDYTPKKVNGVNYCLNGEEVTLSFFSDNFHIPTEYEIKDNDGVISVEDTARQTVRSIHTRIVGGRQEMINMLRYVIEELEDTEDE